MQPFIKHSGRAVPLDLVNVDTDQIIPKQFLKRIERTGFGRYLFFDWRFDPSGKEKSDFVLNRPERKQASVLLARKNFGCGSSREHAPWALQDYGFKVIISPSFADIFFNNCFKNGLLPVVLPEKDVDTLFKKSELNPALDISIDLPAQTVSAEGFSARFEIDPFLKDYLIKGLDDIDLTLHHEAKITAYEKRH